MFEEANVARTERSIINWCQPNRQGVARLDAYFDSNERRYFITPQSVTRAIEEERSKMTANGATPPTQQRDIPQASESLPREERSQPKAASSSESPSEIEEIHHQLRDLEISNRAKDYFIEQLQKERASFNDERQHYIGQMMTYSRQVGELEMKLLQIGAPASESTKSFPLSSEPFGRNDDEFYSNTIRDTDSANGENLE